MNHLIALILLFAAPANAAYLVSDFDSNIGYTTLDVQAGETFQKKADSTSTIELNYNLIFAAADVALTLSFFETIKTTLGDFTLVRIAPGLKWYPWGINGKRLVLDNQIQGRRWKASPFITANFGFTSLSVNSLDDEVFFNAVLFDVFPKAGVEVPMSTDWLLIGQIGYLFSSGSLGGSDDSTEVSYSGLIILAGFKLTSF